MLKALFTRAALQPGITALAILAVAAMIYRLWRLWLDWMRPEHPDRTGNGIGAGTIKTYDNRFLSIRLDELEANLEKLGAIDASKLDDSIGATQGKVTSAIDVAVATSVASAKGEGTGAAEAKDSSKPEGSDAKTAPSALDRLSELINLRYEILSLRMILERSLSDRLWHEGNRDDARLQAVLGLQVSLDPPADFAGCVAVVEVTFKETSGKPISLVALLPQERTSNMLFVGSQSQAASGSNEAGGKRTSVFWRRRLETVSSVREPDTVAFQRPPSLNDAAESLTVGWQFRPPLDRPAVLAGVRQVFAILALPAIDESTGMGGGKPQINIEATTRTYWRRYNPKTRTTSPRWSLVPWHLASDERRHSHQSVDVNFTHDIQQRLKPDVLRIKTTLLGPETVVVMVDGRNFFPGTTVAIGGKVHRDQQSGLLIKSDHHFQVTTTPKALAYGNGVINGRYGPTVPLKVTGSVPGIWVAWCEVELSPDAKFHWLSITIASTKKTSVFTESQLKILPEPIITVDDQVLPPPYYWESSYRQDLATDGFPSQPGDDDPTTSTNCVVLSAWVPAQWNPTSARFKLIFPFCGEEYQHAFGITEFEPAFAINHWSRGDVHCLLVTVTGGEFEKLDRWSVELDNLYTLDPLSPAVGRLSKTQLLLEVPAAALEKCEHLIVRYKDSDETSVYPLQISPLAAPPKPTLEDKTIEISSKSDNFVKIPGTLLDCAGKVRLTRPEQPSPVDLTSSISADGSTLNIYVPMGQKVGFGELVVETKEKDELGRVPVIVKE